MTLTFLVIFGKIRHELNQSFIMSLTHEQSVSKFLRSLSEFDNTYIGYSIRCRNFTRTVSYISQSPDSSRRYVYYLEGTNHVMLSIEKWLLEEWQIVK